MTAHIMATVKGQIDGLSVPRSLALWMAKRYLSRELGMYAQIVSQSWYPFVKMQVRKAEATRSRGEHKRVFVENALKAHLLSCGQQLPSPRDLQLAIELAVREVC